jgi:hypothetical protein
MIPGKGTIRPDLHWDPIHVGATPPSRRSLSLLCLLPENLKVSEKSTLWPQ